MYAEASDGKSPVTLHGAPGLNLVATYGSGPVRGIRYMDGVRYVVSGGSLYGPAGAIGGVSGTGPVIMSDNGTQLVIVTDSNAGYVYTVAGGLAAISDPDFPGATSVDYLDGYFLFTEPDSGIFFISALNDATDIDALDFASAESAPDNLVRVFVDHREVWLMGVDTCEIWTNTGASLFPFERLPGAINEKGLRGKHTVAKADNSIFWVDRDGIVRRAADGYTPVRISTHAVEYAISKGDLDRAEAVSYAQEGHEFYSLTVPGAGTFVYDAATQLWHERESAGADRWRAAGFARYAGVQYVGDFENGNVYALDLDKYTENGTEQIAEMLFPPISFEGSRFRVHSVRLDMEAGTGDTPLVMLQTSKDGKTWSNEAWRDFGALGDYAKRVVWRRLGLFETCHMRFRISDNAKRAVFSAYAEIR
jgi:hypothetical protein